MTHSDKEKKQLSNRKNELQKIINNSYSPYSEFKVTANIETECGKFFSGVNIENSSYAMTICAEAAAIANMVTSLGPEAKIKNILIMGNNDAFCPPCGACRQRIEEFSTDNTKVVLLKPLNEDVSEHKLKDLLPVKFSSDSLTIGETK